MNETLEQLAEDYVYRNRPLTKEERNLLKESKYANLLKKERTPVFNSLLEAALPTEKKEPNALPKKKRIYNEFHPGVDPHTIKDLIRILKKRYNLGIDNYDINQFITPDYSEIKEFILKEFVPKRTDEGSLTRKAIVRATNCKDFEDCWHSLCYSAQHLRREVY